SLDGRQSRRRALLRDHRVDAQDRVRAALLPEGGARRHGAQAQHGGRGQEVEEPCRGRGGSGKNREAAQSLRACRRARDCLPLRRAVGRGGNRPPRRHQPHQRPAVACHLQLRPRAAGGAAEGLVRQERKRRGRPARLHPPRHDEQPRHARAVEAGSGEESGIAEQSPIRPLGAFWARSWGGHATMPASPQRSRFYRLVGLRLYKRPQTARLRGQSMSMASREKPADPRRPVPRLYLVTPQDPAGLADRLAQALDAADVAAVLLRLPQADERTQVNHAKALAPTVQGKGAALLLDGYPDLAVRAGADGAHLSGIDAFMAAVATLKPARIAGCGRLATRHDAMLAAEAGADYVMFGEPDATGRRPAFDAVAERVAWWAELFEVPCVGFAASLDELEPLAAAGADFIALGDCIFADGRGGAAAMADAARRLAAAETVA